MRIKDRYKYLENIDNKNVNDFARSETKKTFEYLKSLKDKKLQSEINNAMYYNYKELPRVSDKYIYWRSYLESEKFYTLLSKKNKEKEKIILREKIAIIEYIPSPFGKYIIYLTDKNGNEIYQAHIITSNGEKIKDFISNIYSILLWNNDEKSFYYQKKTYVNGNISEHSSYKYDIYIHKIGELQTKDKKLFNSNDINKRFLKKIFIRMNISEDSRWLSIRCDSDQNNISLLIKDSKKNITHIIYENVDYIHTAIIKNNKVYLYENRDNEFGCIRVMDLVDVENNNYKSRILIKPKKYLLDFFYCTKDYIYCIYLKNVSNYIKIFNYQGKFVRNLKFPEKGNISRIESTQYNNDIYIQFSSFTIPYSNYKYSFNRDKLELKYIPKIKKQFNHKNYSLKYEIVISRDGTKIPIFIVFNKKTKLNKINPILLYGYGAFGLSQIPVYTPYLLPFLNNGGIYVHAITRGGEEFGDKWHSSVKGAKNKMKTFEDFIACSEYLIAHNYTDKKHLAIHGISAGGLLVAVSMIMRPDLYKCVISNMPIIDMININKYTDEYGNPKKEEDLKYILQWDPLYNIVKKMKYPNILILAAKNDTRAGIYHALKFASKLHDYSTGKTLLYIKNDAGHVWNSIDKYYMIYDFLYKELGMKHVKNN